MPPRKPKKPIKSSEFIDDEAEEDIDEIDELSGDDAAKNELDGEEDDGDGSDLEIVSATPVAKLRAGRITTNKSPSKAKARVIVSEDESDEAVTVKLAPGDSVYKGLPRATKVSTPPLSTRSASKVQAKRPARTEDVSDEDGVVISVRASKKLKSVDLSTMVDKESKSAIKSKIVRTPTRSPVKKKIESSPPVELSDDDDDEPIVALASKRNKSRPKAIDASEDPFANNNSDGADFSDPPPPSAITKGIGRGKTTGAKGKAKAKEVQLASDSDGDGATFGDEFPDQVAPDATEQPTGLILNDLTTSPVAVLPLECEVTNASCDPDEYLVSCKDYVGLPNLRACEFLSWRANAEEPGKVCFSSWARFMDKLPIKKPLLFVRFVQSGQYVNPSRISPVSLRSRKVMSPTGDSRQLTVEDGRIAICISTICTTTSFLFSKQEKRGVIQRTLAGRFHTQEWERYCACIGMVTGYKALSAQYDDGALSFTSKADSPTPTSSSLPSAMFSPRKKTRGAVRSVLGYDDEMIVYDLRDVRLKDFDFPSILEDPVRMAALPRLREEIPLGSFVVVAHTVATYLASKGESSGIPKVNTNFQWAMLLGVQRHLNLPLNK